jgi:hypothetical protein
MNKKRDGSSFTRRLIRRERIVMLPGDGEGDRWILCCLEMKKKIERSSVAWR